MLRFETEQLRGWLHEEEIIDRLWLKNNLVAEVPDICLVTALNAKLVYSFVAIENENINFLRSLQIKVLKSSANFICFCAIVHTQQ